MGSRYKSPRQNRTWYHWQSLSGAADGDIWHGSMAAILQKIITPGAENKVPQPEGPVVQVARFSHSNMVTNWDESQTSRHTKIILTLYNTSICCLIWCPHDIICSILFHFIPIVCPNSLPTDSCPSPSSHLRLLLVNCRRLLQLGDSFQWSPAPNFCWNGSKYVIALFNVTKLQTGEMWPNAFQSLKPHVSQLDTWPREFSTLHRKFGI